MPALQTPLSPRVVQGRMGQVMVSSQWFLLTTTSYSYFPSAPVWTLHGLQFLSGKSALVWVLQGLQETSSSAWIISFCSSFSDLGSLCCFPLFWFHPSSSIRYFLPYLICSKRGIISLADGFNFGCQWVCSGATWNQLWRNALSVFTVKTAESHWDCILWPVLFNRFINDLKKGWRITDFSHFNSKDNGCFKCLGVTA